MPTPILPRSAIRCRNSFRLARSLGAVLAPSLAAAVIGCNQDLPTEPAEPTSSPSLAVAAAAPTFRQVSAASDHTCGVTVENVAYCWGLNHYGELGDGTTTDRARPVSVQGGLHFRVVSAGDSYSCGVTTENVAYCWGSNTYGELGDGTTSDHSTTPVAVAGNRQFRTLDAGGGHTCALSYPDRRAYCWGNNGYGQLGDGSTTLRRTPVAVVGGQAFRSLAAGAYHTCAVTPTYAAYCWGYNRQGQLGDGTEIPQRSQPSLVAGGHQFVQVDAGWYHTCGVTPGDRAFCWGDGRNGQVGDGKTFLRFTPRAVAGGLTFTRVTGGGAHTCGETAGNRAYCWGYNASGQLGDGTHTTRLTPTAVAGGLTFKQVSAGARHTCGVSGADRTYCWGANEFGQLGDRTTTGRPRPTAVVASP
jgi:alpha-tubulin suppressor-like RCC1 family protein